MGWDDGVRSKLTCYTRSLKVVVVGPEDVVAPSTGKGGKKMLPVVMVHLSSVLKMR